MFSTMAIDASSAIQPQNMKLVRKQVASTLLFLPLVSAQGESGCSVYKQKRGLQDDMVDFHGHEVTSKKHRLTRTRLAVLVAGRSRLVNLCTHPSILLRKIFNIVVLSRQTLSSSGH
ncbi:hypothetical protein BaRGS_00007078 [Batillaria attramentaria]|uniref:Uncharacterized protein n=1 Tax=Batillaria attramentaria TaxID=370345 RepID=A0ABD0LQB9_9CAEN